MGVHKGGQRLRTKVSKKPEFSSLKFQLTDFSLAMTVHQFICRYDYHIAQEPDSLFWRHAVMSFLFTICDS